MEQNVMTMAEEPLGGDHINDYAQYLLNIANENNHPAYNYFNNTYVFANPNETVDDVVERWKKLCNEQYEEWKQSPEGIQFFEKEEQRKIDDKSLMQKALNQLDVVDFSTYENTLEFLSRWCYDADSINWGKFNSALLSKLQSSGYESGVNTGPDFQEEDEENFARYIIGQGMDGLSSIGSMHPVLRRFATDWFKKFRGNSFTDKSLQELY